MIKSTRIIALLLALCLMGGALSACDLFSRDDPQDDTQDDLSFVHLTGMTYTTSPYYEPVASRYSYAQLDERQQTLYDRLLEQVYTISREKGDLGKYPMKSVRGPGQFTVAEMRVTLRALSDDHPYLFWLSQTFSHQAYLDENYTLVTAYSEFSPDVLRGMIARTDEVIGAFYAGVPDGLDAYEREKLVHDYVLESCEYDYAIAAQSEVTEQNVRGHSIYGALVDHSCICEGYGTAMQLLLNGLGIDCVTLTGRSGTYAEESLHLWNAVLLDGAWYHVDATWDDQDEEMLHYLYFNVSDDVLLEDHTISVTPDELGDDTIAEKGTEALNLFVPACTRTDYNYYVYECPHLTDYESEAVMEGLYQAALNRDELFSFYVDPQALDYDDAITQLFKESPQYFFNYIAYANDRLADYEIDDSNLTYYLDEIRRCVTLTLHYY